MVGVTRRPGGKQLSSPEGLSQLRESASVPTLTMNLVLNMARITKHTPGRPRHLKAIYQPPPMDPKFSKEMNSSNNFVSPTPAKLTARFSAWSGRFLMQRGELRGLRADARFDLECFEQKVVGNGLCEFGAPVS